MDISQKIALISLGNKIPHGVYQSLYSKHPQVVNYLMDELIVSLCAEGISPGPYRIILNVDNVAKISSVELRADSLVINGDLHLGIKPETYYRCVEFGECRDAADLCLRVLDSLLVFLSREVLSCVMMQVKYGQEDASGVQRILAEYYVQGYEKFRLGNYAEAVQCFRHRGIGLTPAGDDFLCGMLLGMAWLTKVQKKELSKIMDLILHVSEVNDPLIRTFMSQAVKLELDADWAGFLGALGSAGNSYEPWLDKILSHGASSGADQLSGFYLAWELFGSSPAMQL